MGDDPVENTADGLLPLRIYGCHQRFFAGTWALHKADHRDFAGRLRTPDRLGVLDFSAGSHYGKSDGILSCFLGHCFGGQRRDPLLGMPENV